MQKDNPDGPRGSFHSRVAKGTTANIVRQIINVVTQIAAVPVFLAMWGAQLYGEWQVLSAAVAYMVLLDFGMQSYVVNCLGQCYARGDVQHFNRVLNSAVAMSLVACGIAVAVLLPAVFAFPVSDLFDVRATGARGAKIVLCLLAIQTAFLLPIGTIAGVYRATGEYARDVAISNVYRATLLIATLAIVTAGAGVVAVAALQTVLSLCALIFICRDVERRNPSVHVGIRHADRDMAVSFVGPSLLFLAIQASAAASIQGSTLMIGAYLGAGTVAVLATTRAIVNVAPQVTGALSAALWPELTMMEAGRRYGDVDRLHRLSTKVVLLATLVIAVWLHFAGRDIMKLWTGERIVHDQALLDALLLLQIVIAWQLMSSVVLNASNNHRSVAWIRLASSIGGLFCGWALISRFGAAGCVAGLLIADVIAGGYAIPMYACRLAGCSMSRFVREVLGRGIIAASGIYVIAGLAASLLQTITPAGRVVGIGSAVTCASGIILWCIWLDRSERHWLRTFLQKRRSLSTATANA